MEIETLHDLSSAWAQTVHRDIQGILAAHRATGSLQDGFAPFVDLRLRGTVQVVKIAFVAPKHLGYLLHGAGRGYAGTGRATWQDAKGKTRHADPQSVGRAGTKRPAVAVYAPVQQSLPALQAAVSRHFAAQVRTQLAVLTV
jgi:hypothetical protein